jgi:hypothetical protein
MSMFYAGEDSEASSDGGYDPRLPRGNLRGWNYRVISWPESCPDAPSDSRRLEIRRVYWGRYGRDIIDEPTVGKIDRVARGWEHRQEDLPCGNSIEELFVTLERMKAALDKPAISWDEYRAHRKRDIKARKQFEEREAARRAGEAQPAPRSYDGDPLTEC